MGMSDLGAGKSYQPPATAMEMLLRQSLLQQSNWYAMHLYTQHLSQLPQMFFPYQAPPQTMWAQMPPYAQLPAVPMPQAQGALGIPNMPSLGPLNVLAQQLQAWAGPMAQSLLGLPQGALPLFGRYNPFTYWQQMGLSRQTLQLQREAMMADQSSWEHLLSFIPGIGAGLGDPAARRAAVRGPAIAATWLGPLLAPDIYNMLTPGGSALLMYPQLWRAGRLAGVPGVPGMFPFGTNEQMMLRQEFERRIAPGGDALAGLGFTMGLRRGEIGELAFGLAQRGIEPSLDIRAAGRMRDGPRISEQYMRGIQRWNETLSVLMDVFGEQGIPQLLSNLDRLTAGTWVTMGPERVRRLALGMHTLAYQTGVSIPDIQHMTAQAALQAQAAGLPGLIGGDVAGYAIARARAYMVGATPTVLTPTETEMRNVFVQEAIGAAAGRPMREMGAILLHAQSGGAGFMPQEMAAIRAVTGPDTPYETRMAAQRFLYARRGAIVGRIGAREPGIFREIEAPYVAGVAAQYGFTTTAAGATREYATDLLVRGIMGRFGLGRNPARAAAIAERIINVPVGPETPGALRAALAGTNIDVAEMRNLLSELSEGIPGIQTKTPEALLGFLQGMRAQEDVERATAGMEAAVRVFAPQVARGMAGGPARLVGELERIMSGARPDVRGSVVGTMAAVIQGAVSFGTADLGRLATSKDPNDRLLFRQIRAVQAQSMEKSVVAIEQQISQQEEALSDAGSEAARRRITDNLNRLRQEQYALREARAGAIGRAVEAGIPQEDIMDFQISEARRAIVEPLAAQDLQESLRSFTRLQEERKAIETAAPGSREEKPMFVTIVADQTRGPKDSTGP